MSVYRNLNEIIQQFDCTIIDNLKNCIHIALNSSLCSKTIVDSYLMLAQYCLEELNCKGRYIFCINKYHFE